MMEGEMGKLIKVWATSVLSGCYCYAISKTTSKGFLRLLLILPVAVFFAAAPYSLLTYRHFSAVAWSFLTGLGISKLILFSFGTGPLARPHLSLPQFVCTLLLQIKIPNQAQSGSGQVESKLSGCVLSGVKVVGFWCVIQAYNYREGIPAWGLVGLYCCQVYLSLEMLLLVTGAIARGLLGLELAPQTDKPYLSSSLQDFWGRRWNLLVSDVLRQMIHNPIRSFMTPFIGKKTATLLGVFACFIVSGLAHEWFFSLLTLAPPSWEMTWFFVLQGAFLVIELVMKTVIGNKWRLHPMVSGSFTLGFVALTAAWLYFPPLIRNNVLERFIEEYAIFGSFLKKVFNTMI